MRVTGKPDGPPTSVAPSRCSATRRCATAVSSNMRAGRPVAAAKLRFALDSPLEESGFEPLVPLQSWHNRGTGPMSPTASIRVA